MAGFGHLALALEEGAFVQVGDVLIYNRGHRGKRRTRLYIEAPQSMQIHREGRLSPEMVVRVNAMRERFNQLDEERR